MDARIQRIADAAQLACLLEASAPKPGNVTRAQEFEDLKFNHFLAAAVAMRVSVEDVARQAMKARRKEIELEEIRVGRHILNAARDSLAYQRGGNVNSGILLLLMPLSAAMGLSSMNLRKSISTVMESTTVEDAVDFFKSLRLLKPYLEPVSSLDVYSDKSLEELQKKGISLNAVLEKSKDIVAQEVVKGYPITFETAKLLLETTEERGVDEAVTHAFISILANNTDSLIEKKAGKRRAKEVSARAKEILEIGAFTEKGKSEIEKFDAELRSEGKTLNPGSTADLIASSLMLAIVNGLKV